MNKDSVVPSASKRKEKESQDAGKSSGGRQHSLSTTHTNGASPVYTPAINMKTTTWLSNRNDKAGNNFSKKHDNSRLGDVPHSDGISPVDVSRLTENLTKMLNGDSSVTKGKKTSAYLDETQTQQIKKILVDCLQNIDCNLDENAKRHDSKHFCRKPYGKPDKCCVNNENIPLPKTGISLAKPLPTTTDTLAKTSLLRSYLSGSNPAREEYVSKRRNVSNSLISSDSVHHSIFLESGRERRQCLLQYLSNVVGDGQVVIYVNSIPGAEALMNFLKKHGFHVNAVHPKLLLAESNWILSEFSLKKFSVLLCAEDHYHSCPAHFRFIKTIINYELPICNPMENWSIRNGIVEFSDNLPVHIYTFIKKSCPLDYELVKLLRLDAQEDQEMLPVT